MSKYPLDQEALVEEYGDLLIKIALKAYMKEQAQLLEQEEAEAAPVPAPKGNVVAAAFRQVNLEDAKETILSGLKKGVTRVAVVLLAAAITFTTAFAASGTVRTGVFQHVINVIRKYSDLLANTSVMVEQPRYRYDELNVLEIPNEQVQEAFDVWVSFRDSISFWDSSSVYISDLVEALRYYCIEHDLDIPYADATRKWIKADALEQFAEWYFGVDADYLRRVSEVEAGSYDESKGYCNIYSRGTTLTPTAKAALTGYKDNADGTFEMEVTILAIAPMTGEAAEYCNPPINLPTRLGALEHIAVTRRDLLQGIDTLLDTVDGKAAVVAGHCSCNQVTLAVDLDPGGGQVDVLGCPQLEYGTGKGSITLRSAVVAVVEGNRLIIDLGNGQLTALPIIFNRCVGGAIGASAAGHGNGRLCFGSLNGFPLPVLFHLHGDLRAPSVIEEIPIGRCDLSHGKGAFPQLHRTRQLISPCACAIAGDLDHSSGDIIESS